MARRRLLSQLNEGLELGRKLVILAAPAGFGKTTLVSEWLGHKDPPAAWLSLDEDDNDLNRFLVYVIAALQRVAPQLGAGLLGALQGHRPPPANAALSALLNEIAALTSEVVLVIDDYHVIDLPAVDNALAFILEHQPANLRLVLATRVDPNLPLARLRARGQLTELRASDLRFTPAEAAAFLNEVMGLALSPEDVGALEQRTEGWITGLQLAAVSIRGQADVPGFIRAFTGSHHFVLDYLVEEVLHQQPQAVQDFLLRTSILDRLCGPLCDAVLAAPAESSQAVLETLERTNLFIVPLDQERRWYRYHQLFAELLRQRLPLQAAPDGPTVAELHRRASQWYEANGQEVEAFEHAAAGEDVERAERLMDGGGMPLHYRGAMVPVLHWLARLPHEVLEARPSLLVAHATALSHLGQQVNTIEEMLQTAEDALAAVEPTNDRRELLGKIASIRAMLAVPRRQVETILTQSRRALDFLHPDNQSDRTAMTWTLGYAYQIQGQRVEARQAYAEALASSEATGNLMIELAATTCLGQIQFSDNQLPAAVKTYERILQLAGEPPLPGACEAYLGLAQVYYEWNALEEAERYLHLSLPLAQQMENVDTPAACGLLLARLKLAQRDVIGASAALAETEAFVAQHHFEHWRPALAAGQVLVWLRQGMLDEAEHAAGTHPLSLARVRLAQGNSSATLALLEPELGEAEGNHWLDLQLQALVLQALGLRAQGEREAAAQVLATALALGEPGGLIRTFVDEGLPMLALLEEMPAAHVASEVYRQRLLVAFGRGESEQRAAPGGQTLVEPLSDRERDVLNLLKTELTGPEIARQLSVSLSTLRTHTQNIYGKLGVKKRRAAVRRAEELGL